MSNGYVIPVDPAELANRFAAPATLLDDGPSEELDEIASLFSVDDYEARIVPLLDLIPPREADLIHLYFVCKKRQADIAEMFDVTQAAVSYRLDRGIQRLKFLLSIPSVTEEEIREDLDGLFEPIDVDILVGMWRTTCQSEVAKNLRLTQGRVRHRFFKAVGRLQSAADCDERYRAYEQIFTSISSKRFNILRSVCLPQWSDRGLDRCL